jgi:hypothetical protein
MRYPRMSGGETSIKWTVTVIPDEMLFKLIGFESVRSLDVSDYENSDYVFDLNSPPEQLSITERFEMVYDGGTLEHVFNVPNALATIAQLTKIGGYIVHETPCNNYLDHGFYQICPTLFLDFYEANEWEVIDIRLLQIPMGSEDPQVMLKVERMPFFTMEYRAQALSEVRAGGLIDARYNVEFIARKTAKSTFDRVPQQHLYRSAWQVTPR